MAKPTLAVLIFLSISLGLFTFPQSTQAGILDDIKKRNAVVCGFRIGTPGFAAVNENGKLSGFMVDFCKALAAATLGDANAFQAVTLPDKPLEFKAVEQHQVDIALQTTTWTLTRDSSYNIEFIDPIFYDGQGFAILQSGTPPELTSIKDQSICVKSPTTTHRNVIDFSNKINGNWTIREHTTFDSALQAFLAKQCLLLTTDKSVLVTSLSQYRDLGVEYHLYQGVISREPFTPYIPAGDRQWADIVRWVFTTLLVAELEGIDSVNVSEMKDSPQKGASLLNVNEKTAEKLNLPADWVYNIIHQVGNYDEIFERNLGQQSVFKMERGLNRLWRDGGLFYPVVHK
ncbi:transporter substrate-binding domain-containing protein [Terasakiella sp. A23]|uniref:transporter substrate-binding domain-containing protein n=1 Tax=Terasakiella sp. FCG-A23 TaxID=3080561 RepID=UPI0029554D3C|nr:transporter substrate-binding domain-containing protein [Terasakiella sp. A23]MDV7341253.1 transporter substrate-binding domain-containing protein [Terasakiella sp. A23]